MNPRLSHVKPIENYSLELTFNNGEVRRFDVKPYLSIGQFVSLKDKALFSSAKCVLGSIQWQNGLDLCPDMLYEESVAN
jgi:hypothetical protein